jgi:hypothetical protein
VSADTDTVRADIAIVREALVIANDANGCSYDHPVAALDRIEAALARVLGGSGGGCGMSADTDTLVQAVEALIEASHVGEPWQLSAAQNAYASALARVEAEHDRREQRDEWLRTQLDNSIEAAEAVAFATGLATARALLGDLKDAAAALVREGEAAPGSTESGLTAAPDGEAKR